MTRTPKSPDLGLPQDPATFDGQISERCLLMPAICRILREFYSPVIGVLQTHEGLYELSGGQRITFHYKSELNLGRSYWIGLRLLHGSVWVLRFATGLLHRRTERLRWCVQVANR
jgi:hypothetical protein